MAGDTREVERWFLRRGLSALLEGTSMRRRRAARLARTMALVFVLVMVVEVPTFAANLWTAAAISLAVVLVTWVASNLVRRRGPLSLPERITWVETTVFLAFPSLVVLLTARESVQFEGELIPGVLIGLIAAVAVFLTQLLLFAVVNLLAYRAA